MPLNSIPRAWCMSIPMLPASIYNSIITQYSTVMLSTSNNNIMISLLLCCLLYILSIQGQNFQQTVYNAYQAVLISSHSAYYICFATIYGTLYYIQYYPSSTWFFIPTHPFVTKLIYKNHTVKLAYKENVSICKKIFVTRKLISFPSSTLISMRTFWSWRELIYNNCLKRLQHLCVLNDLPYKPFLL